MTKETQERVFIEDLNEKITGAISEQKRYGWLFYFAEINDMQLLHKLDGIIRGFFRRLSDFDYRTPGQLKKLSTAFYKIKYDTFGGYIQNYELYETVPAKIKYLADRGLLNPEKRYSREQIEILFIGVKKKHLSDLDLDVGLIS